jgi:hypothetical protein
MSELYLVSGSDDTTTRIWNPHDGTLKRTINVNTWVEALTTLSNGDLVSGLLSRSIIIWNTLS